MISPRNIFSIKTFFLFGSASIILTACGSGGGSGGNPPPASRPASTSGFAYFIDSAVSGMPYQLDGVGDQKVTGPDGKVELEDSEFVRFNLGGISIDIESPPEVITPNDLFPNNSPAAIALTRLLLSVDSDKNSENGIQISAAAIDNASSYSISIQDLRSPDFDNTPSGRFAAEQNGGVIVTEEDARNHLEATESNIEAEDVDSDGVTDNDDNCFSIPNPDQTDTDSDSAGDVCDTDDDGDGVNDDQDAFPLDNAETLDTDGDGTGNNADSDDDGDGVNDGDDAFPLDNSESIDTDADGIGNNADTDDDGDGVNDDQDAFPLDNTETVDTDDDGTGNNADADDDGDGVTDESDAAPLDPTVQQKPLIWGQSPWGVKSIWSEE